MASSPKGFSRSFTDRTAPAIGVFGPAGAGKSRFLATATEWALERGKVPGWLVCDRKTRKTIKEIHSAHGWDLPYINEHDFIETKETIRIMKLDREAEKENTEIQKIYTGVFKRVLEAAGELADSNDVDPIIIETGNQVYDYISFAHFGKKQGAGKSRVWGPPKQDWTDLMMALAHKTVLISFWEKSAYDGDEKLKYTEPQGPPHLDYTTTTLVRLRQNEKKKVDDYTERFELDIYKSQENKALEGEKALLTGEAITYTNLMQLLVPDED